MRPWILAGFVVFAVLEIVGLVEPAVMGRVTLTTAMIPGLVLITLLVGLMGVAFGWAFFKLTGRGIFGGMNPYLQGALAITVFNLAGALVSGGHGFRLPLSSQIFGWVTNAAAGALFVWLAIRFGATIGSGPAQDPAGPDELTR